MMRRWASRYVSYISALLVVAVCAIAVEIAALAAVARFGPIRIDGPGVSEIIGYDGLMALVALVLCCPALVGAALGLQVYRAVSWLGWQVKPAWRNLAAIWSMVSLLAFGLAYMFFLDQISAFAALGAFGAAVTTLGFGVHLAAWRVEPATPH